jgi:hypothetical protein
MSATVPYTSWTGTVTVFATFIEADFSILEWKVDDHITVLTSLPSKGIFHVK